MKEKIKQLALENAIKYGQARPGAVIGHLAADKKIKNIKKLIPEINKIINEVNSLSNEERLRLYKPIKKEKKIEKKELPNLKNPKKVVMRFMPSPSGPAHIGHSYVCSLNSEYCKKYKGKFILKIDDTNPENIYPLAYDMLENELQWLTKNNIKQILKSSERLEIYYKYAKKLIKSKHAYVCTCNPDIFRELRAKSQPCPCRDLKDQEKKFQDMFKKYSPGQAVLRIKTNIKDKNPAMRDFPVLRINDHFHPITKNKYKVWPLMNFSSAIDDLDLKVTHSIRAKEHADNAKKQAIIHKYLKVKTPESLFVGRINFTDLKVSASQTRRLIEDGKYSGWYDPRLPFLAALRKRGFQPEAFIKYALDVGVTLTDKTVSKEEFFKKIEHFNKEIIDKTSNRYFFIENPKKIKIKKAPKINTKAPLHPDFPKRGSRILKTKGEFYIQDKLEKNKIYRFMHLFNFKNNEFISEKYDPRLDATLIHWLPVSKDLVNVEIVMPDASIKKGLGEPSLKKVKVDSIVQMERMGFCKLDEKKKNKLIFYYAHN